MEIIDAITQLIPVKYLPYLGLLPVAGRIYHALKNGGGIVGVWKSLMFGVTAAAPAKEEEIK